MRCRQYHIRVGGGGYTFLLPADARGEEIMAEIMAGLLTAMPPGPPGLVDLRCEIVSEFDPIEELTRGWAP